MTNEKLNAELEKKWTKLFGGLSGYSSAVIAYSGGVDSSFLTYAAIQALGQKITAVTVVSPILSQSMLDQAAAFASQAGFIHIVLPVEQLDNTIFVSNPPDRCYHCKKLYLDRLSAYANENHFEVVLEGQNVDDLSDYRPGSRAVKESSVRSPLAENGFTKQEIRLLARHFGLTVWDQPSTPCLATRIPYGSPVTNLALRQIEHAEDFLLEQGFQIVRVRHFGDMARIEVLPEKIGALVSKREEIVKVFSEIGYKYVTIDLQGYRMGSLNEVLLI
jgi:uncharacterized protein